jgi:hypothetical protein
LNSLQSRLKLVKAVVVLAFVAGFLLSPGLWITKERFFPVLSPIDSLPIIVFPFDIMLLLLFIGLGVTWIFCKKRLIGLIVMTSLIAVLVQDQMRWQPWVYQYCILLLPYLLQPDTPKNEKSIFRCLQWVIAGVYVWSGIQKLNPGFIKGTFAQIIEASGTELVFSKWENAGYIIPFIEMLTGVALLSSRFRKVGIYTAVIVHVAILSFLSPMMLDRNSVVYPWNVVMILFVLLLYRGVEMEGNTLSTVRKGLINPLKMTPIVLIWAFPVFNFWGYWDHYLSFSLYSNKPPTFYIAIEENEIHKIDKRFQQYFVVIPGLQGGQLIDIDKWALSELNVPFYPQHRLFKKMSHRFCNLNIDEDNILFIEASYLNGQPLYKTFTCKEM